MTSRLGLRLSLLPGVFAALVLAGAFAAAPAAAFGPFPEHIGPDEFGVFSFRDAAENQDGSPVSQAGSHPFALTTAIMFNHTVTAEEERIIENFPEFVEEVGPQTPTGEPEIVASIFGSPRDIEVALPRGVVVNPGATSVKCTEAQLETTPSQGGGCPAASAVGVSIPAVSPFGEEFRSAIYNMVPPPGVPAEFGIDPGLGLIFHVVGRLRTGGDYGLSGVASDTTQKLSVYGAKLIFWGDPTAEIHDTERDLCAKSGKVEKEVEKEFFENGFERDRFNCPLAPGERTGTPLLTMPGSCTGSPLEATLNADTWQEPKHVIGPPAPNTTATSSAVEGCEALHFNPSMSVTPTSTAAESPTGVDVDLKFPLKDAEGLAEANLKTAVVTLPPGMAASPSAANGLGACTPEEIGLHDASAPSCPDSSKLGEAEVTTPLLEKPLKGAVYLAQQETFEGALIALYLVVEGQGALIKLGGTVALDPGTGQITATFDNNPQLPFTELKLHFFDGPRAPLVTPSGCGTYTTESQLTPWSATAPLSSPSAFAIESGCNHPFAPSFTAGSTNLQAGAYTPFSLTISRRDGEGRLATASGEGPPGLAANLRNVPLCGEPQASRGECPPESLVGEATASAGPGPEPFWVHGGRAYLTGPYGGAPFGLSIVVPAIAGPFNLGNVIARAAINVDPRTAQAIVTSTLPTIKDGIPLDVRSVNVTLNRPGFMLNPTSCTPSAVTATLTSTAGASAAVSSPFDVANCAALQFRPSFTVSTPRRASRADGAAVSFKITYPPVHGSGKGSLGSASWFNEAKFEIPKQLPARLTTIQQACRAETFEHERSKCPAHSIIGHAVLHTQIIPVPLEGSVYFVSYGGAKFPDAVLVLDGYGIHIELHGNTFINSKTGVTSATFNETPDVPFESIEVTLPSGPYSEFGANLPNGSYDYCGRKLVMPTLFKAQNGAVIQQNTPVTVSGCPKTKTRAQKLTAALKACHKKHRSSRPTCERAARAKYASRPQRPLKRKR